MTEQLDADERAVLDALADGPQWPDMPEAIEVHHEVDLGSPDPADQGDEHDWRRCVARRRDAHRCGGRALDNALLCPMHEGRAAPMIGVEARVRKQKAAAKGAEEIAALRRLGTRQIVAAAFLRNAEHIDATIDGLALAAGTGDREAAKLLLPWLDQGLGRPTEHVEVTQPASLQDLEHLPTQELELLVAQGRARRLQLVREHEGEPDAVESPSPEAEAG
jgi:hypothetical protein